jgi:hypothetical protein
MVGKEMMSGIWHCAPPNMAMRERGYGSPYYDDEMIGEWTVSFRPVVMDHGDKLQKFP